MKILSLRLLLASLLMLCSLTLLAEEDYCKCKPRFVWGASAGGSVDMTNSDMSSIDLEIGLGVRNRSYDFLGVGAGADVMLSNSCRSFPIFAEIRTNFLDHETVMYGNFKIGASINFLEHKKTQTGIYTFLGVGFNLLRSKDFRTYLVLGYTMKQNGVYIYNEVEDRYRNLHLATVKIGVSF